MTQYPHALYLPGTYYGIPEENEELHMHRSQLARVNKLTRPVRLSRP